MISEVRRNNDWMDIRDSYSVTYGLGEGIFIYLFWLVGGIFCLVMDIFGLVIHISGLVMALGLKRVLVLFCWC